MKKKSNVKSSKRNLYAIVAVLFTISILYRVLAEYNLTHTSFLFVGIPALLAILLIKYTDKPKSTFGIVFRTLTIFLLLSFILLGEGTVCVIFAAPIFYAIAAIIVVIYEYFRKKGNADLSAIIIFPLIVLLAQPHKINNIPEVKTKVTTAVVHKKVNLESFAKTPDFMQDLPGFFKLGFPKPLDIKGEGIEVGHQIEIRFKSTTKGIGTLVLEVIEKGEQLIVFKPISDDTHIGRWLKWNKIFVELKEVEGNKTEVKWTSEYQCKLGPSWYFEPLEGFAVELMNKHLINTYFDE